MQSSRLLRSLVLLFGLLLPALALGAAATLTFHQSAALHAGDPDSRTNFGMAIAFEEDASGVPTALIGAPGWDQDGRIYQGAAYVFTRGASGWVQGQRLLADPPEIGGTFGNSIALDLNAPGGPTAVVGSLYADPNPPIPGDHTRESGAVFVFIRAGDAWVQQAKLQAPQQLPAARLGASVAIDGDTLVAGAPNSDAGEEAVYVWTRGGATWTLQGKLTGDQPDVHFGAKVAIQGDTILVGATGQTVDGDAAQGAVHVFTRAGGVWSPAGRFSPADAGPDARFGNAIALNGDAALVAAHGPGVAYLYHRAGGVWTQGPKLTPPNYDNRPINANAVALDGDLAAIGSNDFRVNDDPDVTGGAYVFQRAGGTWTPVELLMPGDTHSLDYAGAPVAIQGDTILVGAPYRNFQSHEQAGMVFAFTGGEKPTHFAFLPIVLRAGPALPAQPIVYTESVEGDAYLYSIRPDGTGKTRLSTGTGIEDWWANWSPDHRRILFTRTTLTGTTVMAMDANGGNVQQLFSAYLNGLDVFYPTWNGTKIAFIGRTRPGSQYGLYVINPDGSGLGNLTPGLTGEMGWPAWSPDGTQIAFSLWRQVGEEDETQDLAIINADGSGLRYLTGPEGHEHSPDWSPDGKTLAFTGWIGGKSGLFTMPVAGGAATHVQGGAQYPAWSPDGRFITFSTLNGGIYRVPAGGGEVFVLDASREATLPDW